MDKKLKIDYSKYSLEDIIKKKIKKNISFFELEDDEKIEVLEYIKFHKIDVRVYGKRWYDILKNQFFVEEYKLSDKYLWEIDKVELEFKSFKDYFETLGGDIYSMSCYYGYEFSDDDKKNFSINLDKINFESFESSTLDLFTFDYLLDEKKKKSDEIAKRTKSMIKWFDNIKSLSSYDNLCKKYNQFIKKYEIELIFCR